MNIYVGNLAWKVKKQDLEELFAHFGGVTRSFIVRDKATRRSKGYAFVEMPENDEALAAIEHLNNTVFMDRALVVNEANPRREEDNNEDILLDDEE